MPVVYPSLVAVAPTEKPLNCPPEIVGRPSAVRPTGPPPRKISLTEPFAVMFPELCVVLLADVALVFPSTLDSAAPSTSHTTITRKSAAPEAVNVNVCAAPPVQLATYIIRAQP